MNRYPCGLHARANYFRVLKSVWTLDCQKFVLQRMKDSPNNIKSVIVLDDSTKSCKCFFPNDSLTSFTLQTDSQSKRYCIEVESISKWFIERTVKQYKHDKSLKITKY